MAELERRYDGLAVEKDMQAYWAENKIFDFAQDETQAIIHKNCLNSLFWNWPVADTPISKNPLCCGVPNVRHPSRRRNWTLRILIPGSIM